MTRPPPRPHGELSRFSIVLLAASCLLFSRAALAVPILASSTTFQAADPARTFMDIGGVWNGTSEVTATTGDTFQFTVCNTAPNLADVAYSVSASAVLPANFTYVANTANGLPGITAAQVGTALTFTIPGDPSISTGTCATIGFGLSAGAAVAAGTYPVNYTVVYSTSDLGAPHTLPILQNVLVQAGAATIVKGPANQLIAVGNPVAWAVTVTNTGGGGLFGVSIDEAAINPSATISFTSMTQLAPAVPAVTGSGAKFTLPYLAAGQQYTESVAATVTGCLNLNNTAAVDDRTHVSAGTASTQVLLDFRTPLVAFSAPPISLNNLGVTHVSVPVSNTGHGDARNVVLGTTLAAYPVTVSNVSSDWHYDAASGSFTKTFNGGTVSSNTIAETLTFDVAPSGGAQCTPPAGGLYFVTGNYTDVCGNPYVNPVSFNNLSSAYTQPSIGLNVAAPGSITAPTTSQLTILTVTITRPDLITTDPIVVVDTLPANVGSVSLGALSGGQTASCTFGACQPGDPITWTIPNPGGASTLVYSLNITYAVPAVTCSDNQFAVDAATTSVFDGLACEYTANGSASSVLTNTVSTNVTTGYTEAYSIGGGVHETGLPDNGNGARDPGEGAFIPISSTFTFPAGYAGTWTGSFYTENYGGTSSMTLVPNSLKVSWDGGAAVAVPGASLTQTASSFSFTTDFLAGPSFINAPSVANHAVSFTYETTAADAVLGANGTASLSHFSDFVVAGASGACTGSTVTRIIQFAPDGVARAVESLSLAMPSVVDMCQVFTATATITGSNFNAFTTSAAVVTNSSYTYLTPQTPNYGGNYTSGNVTYAENGGVFPTFAYTGAGTIGAGSFGVQFRRRATAATNNAAVGATAAYADWQLNPTSPPGAPLTLAASATPVQTQKGRLVLTATPQAVSVTGNQVVWVIYANNAGSGGIYGMTLKDVIPAGLTINVSSTNLQNPNYPVTVNLTTVTWSTLNGIAPIDIPAGGGIAFTVVADVSGGICSIPAGTPAEEGVWGCDGSNAEDVLNSNPSFTFPTGSIQAVHDSVNTFTQLCSFNYDTMIVRNTGLATVYGIQMQEILNPSVTGVDIVPGSVQISTNAGSTWTPLGPAGDPSGAGTTASPYTWSAAQSALLATLAPFGTGNYSSIYLRVEITAAESSNGLLPSVTTKANGTTACGQAVADPGTPFTLLVQKPNMTVTKVGRNVTAGQAGFSSTVYGGQGDQIVWQITVQNNGDQPADHLRLLEVLASDGGAATVSGSGITGTPPVTSGVTIGISTLAALGSNVYTVNETLGPTCVAAVNTANASWGCVENAAGQISNLNTPTTSTATAGLVMTPQFVNASSTVTFNALSGGRAEVVIHYVNTGGTAQNVVIYSTIPAGMALDATSTPTFSGAAGAGTSIGTLAAPAFSFAGSARNGDFIEVRYDVIQTGDFDTATSSFNFPDSIGAGTDPALPSGGALPAEIDYSNTCAGASSQTIAGVLTPPTPNVNISVTPVYSTATAGVPMSFTYSLTDAGRPGSIADHVVFNLPPAALGAGWTVNSVTLNTAGSGGTPGACAANTCTAGQIGTLAFGTTAVVTVNATPLDNGQPLTMQGLAVGTLFTINGTNTGNNYSFDAAASKVVGVAVSKSLLSTSEPSTSTGTLAIGEEATFQLQAHWFGGAGIGGITVRDTLPPGLGFVSFSTTTGHDLPVPTQSGAPVTPVNSGTLNLTIPDFAGNGTFLVDVVARELNVGGNTNGLVQTNSLDVQFNSNSQVFGSNDPVTGFGGTLPSLHASTTTTVARPILTFTKQVEDFTTNPGGPYAATAHAAGGDTMQYRLVVTNTGRAPAFDITVADALASAKLLMVDGSGGGGTFVAGAGGSVTYNNANYPGHNLGEMDPGQSSTMTYQAVVDVSATPNDSLFNGATFYAGSLPGINANESQNKGAPGSTTGETLFTSSQFTPVSVTSITFSKTLTTTSLGFVSTNVVVGEQVQFLLTLVMPAGTTPGLNIFDSLPAGLRLVQTPAVTLGAAVSPVVPAITPAVPADAAHVNWNFGTVTVASNSAPGVPTTALERTITIPYVAQVDNAAAVIDGATIVNSSSYTYLGSPPVNAASVSLAVKESSGAISIAPASFAGITAGQVIVATITVTNAGHAAADDLNLVVSLPSWLSYVGGTTSGLGGPAIGEPDVSGPLLTYGRTQGTPQVINVTTTTALKFQINLLVDPGILPSQPQPITAIDDWTSLAGLSGPSPFVAVGAAGTASGERTGVGGIPNKYFSVASATATAANTYSVLKSSTPGPNPDGSYRVGDLISYSVKTNFQAGTVLNARIVDVLPAGLAFDSFDPITPASGTGNFAYTAPAGSSAPVAGNTGALTWFFGAVTNSGPGSAPLTLTYRVRVLDAGGIAAVPTKTNLINAANFRYDNFVPAANATGVSGSTVTVEQSSVTFSKILQPGQPTTVAAGAPVNYRITVTNGGSGPAYDLKVQDVLPVGLRTATPVVSSVTLNGVGIVPTTNLAQTYNSGTGVVQWTLTDAQVLLGSVAGSTLTLRIDYAATVDAGEGAALTLTNNANVVQSFSLDSSGAGNRRTYGVSNSSAAAVTTPVPTGIGKSVSLSSAAIGAAPAYTIVVPTATIAVPLYNVRVQDAIPAGLLLGAHGDNHAAIAPGVCGSINVTDNSNATSLDLTYDCLPPGAQAVVSATATVKDVAGNVIGTSISNSASYTWTQTPAGAVQAAISTSGITTVVVEPELAISKIFLSSSPANPAEGLQAGDNVTYRIKVVNAAGPNVAPAYNLAIFDIADQNLTAPAVTADPDNPGAPANLGIAAGNATFQWNVPGPLAPGATYQFDVQFTLGPGVQPMQTLVNTSSVTWTSLSPPGGAGVGQRDGSGSPAVNNYIAAAPSPVSVVVGPVHMEKVIKAPGGTTYEVGQPAVYRLPFTFGQGAVNAVNIEDLLPANMAYDGVVLSASNVQKAGGGAVAIVSGPSAGASGTLVFNLGDLQSTGPNPEVDLDVSAHATNAGGNVNGTTLTNGVEALVTSSTGGVVGIGPLAGVPTITVIEPNLTLTKVLDAGQSANVLAGSPVNYVLTAKNGGLGAAYDVQVQDTLPVGMRTATPVVSSATLNGVGVAPLTNLGQTYNAGTGVAQWTLTDAQVLNGSVSGSTLTLMIAYTAQVDAGVGAGLSLTNSALVTQYFSRPASSPTDRRTYAPTATASKTVTTPPPAGIGKAVSISSAAIGAAPAYTITVPTTTVGVALYNVRVQDAIPAGLALGAHGDNHASLALGPCPSITITDNSTANSLDVSYSCLPPGTQAVVSATTTVSDVGGNVRGAVLSNSASYTWTQTPAGSVQPTISTAGITTAVVEPVLAVSKVFLSSVPANPAEGLQAGDNVTYRVKIVNALAANVAPAYNLAIFDIADQNLTAPSVTADPDNPGAPTNLGIGGGNATFQWNVPGPLQPGATYQFDVTFTLGAGVQPMQTLLNTSSVTWTSLAPPGGAGVGQRDGSGVPAVNNYAAAAPSPVSVVIGPAHIEKAIKAPGGTNYAPGQTATYRLDFTFGQGLVHAVHVLDALPAGLIYSTAAVSAANAQAGGGGAVAILSGPAPGATGSLDFSLGDLQSGGASPVVHVDVSARVANVGGNVNGQTLTNGTSAMVTSSTGGVVGVGPMNALPVITVVEPKLVLAHDAPPGATIDLGGISTFTVRTENFGTSPAYQPTVQVQLGAGLRANSTPAASPTTAAISGGRALVLLSGTDYTTAYSSTTGLLSYVFASSVSFVAPGEVLTLGYQATPDNDAVNAAVLDSTAAVTQYYSQDASLGVGADTRLYSNLLSGSAGHIANGAAQQNSDGFGDDAPVTVRAPLLNVVKSVTPFVATLPQNTTLTWGVSIVNAGAIPSAGSILSDDLGSFGPTSLYISSATLSTVTVVGAGGAYVDASNPSGGTSNRGLVSLSNLIIPAASTVTVTFSVNISSSIPNATKIFNRAALTVPGFTAPFTSLSNRLADGVGPTAATINSTPGFLFNKTAAVAGGGPLVDGSTITYTLRIRNQGTERSLSSLLTDGIPADTVYVPGSTTLNGSPVSDVRGASPLSSGMSVNSPSETPGILDVYSGAGEADVTFSVRVGTGVPNGAAISNQGLLTGQGEGTGTPIVKLSDDPTTAPAPDPTVLIVSGAPFLVSEKTSSIDVGPALLDNGTLTYSIAVRNLGNVAATQVVLVDPIPANSSYVAGSLRFGVGVSTPVATIAMTDAADGDAGSYNVAAASVTVAIGTVPANGTASIVFRVRAPAAAPDGTLIANQATITSPSLPTILSDGDGNHANGSQPTYNVVGATGAAILQQTKQVTALNGGTVNPGDPLLYLITTTNVGNSTATNVTVTDPVPGANSAYSTGTTQLNGVLVPDAGLISPLVAGYNIGSLNPGQSQLITYRVNVASAAAVSVNVDNQASFTATGGITGTSCSDRPDCITRVQVGGTPGSAAVSGRVWLDLLHNRVYTAGTDQPQPNWLVEVVLGGVVAGSVRTAPDGSYRVSGLTPGAGYQVRFRDPTTNVVYGQAISAVAGADTSDGTIRNLTLASGDNILNQSLPLDPNGVLYDAITRKPVAGAQVFLLGPPGFDPALHLLPLQNGQITDATGLYRFDINFGAGAPLGVYTLQMAAPPGYLSSLPSTPSTLIGPSASTGGCAQAACLTVPLNPPGPDPDLIQAQNTAPTVLQATPYFLRFNYVPGTSVAVVNNHIPLDPVLSNAIFVTKTARVVDVSKGDLVAYTITARNTVATTLTNINLVDLLPPGFAFRSGSGVVNGVSTPPVASGRQLTWGGLTFGVGETKTFTLLLIVGSGVGYGPYVNEAWAVNTQVNAVVSNVAAATVRVTPDPTLDCTDVIGKVFDDVNANGYQDQGEPGLPNVRVVTARGWLIDTDAQGRFHVACALVPNQDRGSNFVMKLDEKTLPTGYRVTTENPRSIRATAGKFARLDFGAALFRVYRLDLSNDAFRIVKTPKPAAEPEITWDVVVDSAAIPPLRFKVAKFEITDEHLALIHDALTRVQSMQDVRNVRLQVVGHTDSTPIVGSLKRTIPDNWALSRSRASATAVLLREKLGLAANMIVVDGEAESQPLASNATPEGRALNRRVEIQVIYRKKIVHAPPAVIAFTSALPSSSWAPWEDDERPPWRRAVDRLINGLNDRPGVLRLGYCRGPGEKLEDARARILHVSKEVRRIWQSKPDRYALTIEDEIDGSACSGSSP